jgi:hypothetical protein
MMGWRGILVKPICVVAQKKAADCFQSAAWMINGRSERVRMSHSDAAFHGEVRMKKLHKG